MSEVSIYALCEPDTGEVRYIGQSVNPDMRLKQHEGLFGRTKLKGPWIAALQAQGLTPRVSVLEVVSGTATEASEREAYHIARHLAQGSRLVNVKGVPGNLKNRRHEAGKVMTFETMVRLPESDGEEFQAVAKEKGLAPAVLARLWIMERLREERRRVERGDRHE